MMHNDAMSQLDLLVKRFSPPLLEVSRDSAEEPSLAPGERVQAHVLANLPNGRFHVLIKDQVLDMNLPPNTQAGDKLDLSVVRSQPRLTFALTEDLRQALPPATANVKLSDAIKYLGALLNRAAPDTLDEAPLTRNVEPLLPAKMAQVDTSKLSDTLKQRLAESGVFFESHQAEWVTGQRSLQSLMREPQAQFASNANPPSPDMATDIPVETRPAKEALPPGISNVNQSRTTGAATEPDLRADPAVQPASSSLSQTEGRVALPPAEHAQLRELVQQQLNCLDTRQLTWSGFAWPNQTMEWVVEEQHEQNTTGEAEQAVWYSRLHLDLPNLGAITAAVSLQNGAVKVHFQSNHATAGLLRGHQARLENQLAAAGMQLLGTTVDGRDES